MSGESNNIIIKIKYKALHWNNHQGGSGNPFDGELLRSIRDFSGVKHLLDYGRQELEKESVKNRTLIGDYILVGIEITA